MRVLLVAAAIACLTLAGCSGSSTQSSSSSSGATTTAPPMDHSAKSYAISMSGNAFSNTTLMIKTGDEVVWTHNDPATTPHTVTSDAGGDAFDSSPNCVAPAGPPVPGVPGGCLTAGDSFHHVFAKEGTFGVHCKIHASMTMTVTVMSHNMTMEAAE